MYRLGTDLVRGFRFDADLLSLIVGYRKGDLQTIKIRV